MPHTTRPCPFCAEEIKTAALVCKHCGNAVGDAQQPEPVSVDTEAQPQKRRWSVVWAFVALQIVIIELFFLGLALDYLQQIDASAQTFLAVLLFLIFTFTLITGKGIPHFRHRGKALLFLLVAGFFSIQGATISSEQREAHLAELRETNPSAYLDELRGIDEDRWFAALRELDPEAHAVEAKRRAAEAERQAAQAAVERLAKCTDRKSVEAYVMIQADVRRGLRAPATAKFPGRYGDGTRHIGNCVYQVVGHFDAQNGFGAMLRGTFSGTIEYFPDRGSWRTLTLDVQG